MPSYKLCYFPARGYGEMSRLLFAEAGVPYEDVRYSHEEWPKHKGEMQFGQMPVLFVDNEQIAHSRAIVRYLAREFKLDGGCSLTAAKIDTWIEAIFEAISKLPFGEKDEKKKEEGFASVMKEHVGPKFKKIDEQIASSGGPYVFGKNLTALDFIVFNAIDGMIKMRGEGILEHIPNIKALMAKIEARPNIAKWLKERPVTEF